jgi:ABC-type glycerol-3-phosphate transport system permease component
MILLVAFTSLPLIYLISTAFKPLDELFIFPPRFLAMRPTWENFSGLFTALSSTEVPFARYVFNSVLVSVLTVFGTVIICSMGAFGLVKYKPPCANFIFNLVVAALMFPTEVTQIPSYMVVNKLHLINTYAALIIPKLAVAYNLFLMKQFIEQTPDELIESAKIDGARPITIYWKIIMPLLKPAVFTLIVFAFQSSWNDYFWPLVYITSESMKTMPLAIQTISGGTTDLARAGAVAAASLATIIPTIIVFLIMQSGVIETMAYSGIKA